MLEIIDFCASVQNVKLKVGTQFLKRNEFKQGNSFNCWQYFISSENLFRGKIVIKNLIQNNNLSKTEKWDLL
ncbi:MAG: hypothetical protein BRC47_14680 [Cyanobacteria bacterium QS_7_48_42]|nr:MAG: hypothetical protein BRC47_14680 [Cyanobacteria bacterium QS_7_48_42]